MQRRVVVTGMGAVSPLGVDLATTWERLVQGQSGVGPITKFNTDGYRTKIAAEAKDFDPNDYFDRKQVRRLDTFAQFALVAAHEAIATSGISLEDDGKGVAVIIGSGIGGMGTVTEQIRVLTDRGARRVSPFLIPMILPETAASQVAIEFGLKGPNMAVTSACATGANAIGESYHMLKHGVTDVAVCGGTEAGVIEIAVAGFGAMRAISTRNDEPQRASRPFDRDRDGFVIGEGAGILVLETLERAKERGAHILGEIIGYCSNDDAYHITAPQEDGIGAADCMRGALASASLDVSELDYINAHGTSTPLNDVTETKAIKAVLGDRAYEVAISSTKSMTGHPLGAGGALEAIFCIQAIREAVIPPTINLDHPDPECDLDYVPHTAREQSITTALSNSFGFGGHNACLVFKAYEEA